MEHVTTLLLALIGGVGASLVAGYFARPKTKGEAAQANANATVSLSADAREWAQLWMTKADEAQKEAKEARAEAHETSERLDDAEERVTELDNRMSASIVYMDTLRTEIVRLGGHPPQPPSILHDLVRPVPSESREE